QQIENRINQDSYISQQLNLWSQGGSEVIRGNLLVIPMEDTVLYVEPVYIESSNETSLPEVKQVIMAYEDQIVMEETFDKALEEILAYTDPDGEKSKDKDKEKELEEEIPGEGDEDTEEPEDTKEPPTSDAEESIQKSSQLLEDYQKAVSNGDFEKAGAILEELEAELNKFK